MVSGAPEDTGSKVVTALAAFGADRVLWVTGGQVARDALGRGYDAVVLSLHDGVDADVLGRCHGLVCGGGALVLRVPPQGTQPPGRPALAVWPHGPDEVGQRFWARLVQRLLPLANGVQTLSAPTAGPPTGTAEQREVIRLLEDTLGGEQPVVGRAVLVARRGRGKSAALGMALATLEHEVGARIAVTGPHMRAVEEVLRFAPWARFRPIETLCVPSEGIGAIVVDEAAQIPVPVLRELVRAHPQARFAFATTTEGYEGTGRGFVLRFLEWLRLQPAPIAEVTLSEPIRWGAGDPLEARLTDSLALDAVPAPAHEVSGARASTVLATRLSADRLAADEGLLRDVFGLLVHAHYRTTPSDLQRLLDAPNLEVHALLWRGRAVAANVVALEGALPEARCRAVTHGGQRLRGHALPETLMCHAGRLDAGRLRMVRSMRIAVHPALRRRGLATQLVAHVHASHEPDLFGTLFGATPQVLRFRRSLGYHLVRLGASRGTRTGEPSAVMIRACSSRGAALVASLERDLDRELPLQLALLGAEGPALEPPLVHALTSELRDPEPLTSEELAAIVAHYAHGPRPFEAAAYALRVFWERRGASVGELGPDERTLVEDRVVHGVSWRQISEGRGESVPASMRSLKRAFRALVAQVP